MSQTCHNRKWDQINCVKTLRRDVDRATIVTTQRAGSGRHCGCRAVRPDADDAETAGEGSSRVGEGIGSGAFSGQGGLGPDRLARTSLAYVAAQSVSNVELLLRDGASEDSMEIDNQLRVFEPYDRGLLATWETPGALICVLRTDVGSAAD
jgi:hypothetical protein